jgi:hypothetical protein
MVVAAQTAAAALPSPVIGTRDFAYPSTVHDPTADKPQSKLWYLDGSWWGLLVAPGGGVHVFELMGNHTWRDTGAVVDPASGAAGDALWDGSRLYVALRTGSGPVRVTRLAYDPPARTYHVDGGFPATASGTATAQTVGRINSVSLVKDTAGTLWVAFTSGSRVLVAHSVGDDAHWSAPAQPAGPAQFPTNSVDAGAALVAFGNQVGLMWTNPDPGAFRFIVHRDGDPATAWSGVETPLQGMGANNHMNLKSVPGDPRVFGVVKTSLHASNDQPRIMLLVRDTGGHWSHTAVSAVGDDETRPQVLLDPGAHRLTVLMARRADGSIRAKDTSMDAPSFGAGPGTVIIDDSSEVNNVTTTRQPVSAATGIVALASADAIHTYEHAELGSVPHRAAGGFRSGGAGTGAGAGGAAGGADGYRLVASDGGVFTFGTAPFYGSTGNLRLNAPIIGMAPTDGGYLLVGRDGGVFTFGSAPFLGSNGGRRGAPPTVGIATGPSGYWIADAAGTVTAFGVTAAGSVGQPLNRPIVGIAATPSGGGYWLVASDGGVFAFGDAPFLGSTGNRRLNAPIVGIAPTSSGRGYWLVASDGGVFTFGDAAFLGSTGNRRLNAPVVSMLATSDRGYRLIASDGGVFTFGDARFLGSMGGVRLNRPVVGVTSS